MELLAAATQADPYPFYASLREQGGMIHHSETGMWVATDATSVASILAHPDCHVRPPNEPVPALIQGTPAGDLFATLMRMNEGSRHRCTRTALTPLLSLPNSDRLAELSATFLTGLNAYETGEQLRRWMFEFPVRAIARQLGLADKTSTELPRLVDDFVACLSPLSCSARLQAADNAAEQLQERIRQTLQDASSPDSPAHRMYREKMVSGEIAESAIVGNLIGLLSQTYEATAGLIGNTIASVARAPELDRQVRHSQLPVQDLVTEVLRYDSPVQNTRRFASCDCEIDGQTLPTGSIVLVLLASANRDPALHENPDTLSPHRKRGRIFSFGGDRHECPGQPLAIAVATRAVAALLSQMTARDLHELRWTYHASINGRIPHFNHS